MKTKLTKYLIAVAGTFTLVSGISACSEVGRTDVTSRQLTDGDDSFVCTIIAEDGVFLYGSSALLPIMQPSLAFIDRGVVVDLVHDEVPPSFGFRGPTNKLNLVHVSNRLGERFSGSEVSEGYVELVDSMGVKHVECVHVAPCAVEEKISLNFRPNRQLTSTARFVLQPHTPITILKYDEDDWAHVWLDKQYIEDGGSSKGYLKLKHSGEEFTTCSLSPLKSCKIRAEYGLLTLRKDPGTDKDIVTDGNGHKVYLASSYGSLPVFDAVEVETATETGIWHQVKWSHNVGWIATTYNDSIYADCTPDPASTTAHGANDIVAEADSEQLQSLGRCTVLYYDGLKPEVEAEFHSESNMERIPKGDVVDYYDKRTSYDKLSLKESIVWYRVSAKNDDGTVGFGWIAATRDAVNYADCVPNDSLPND